MNDLRNAQTLDERLDDVEPAPLPTEAELARVVTLAREQLRLELEIEKLEKLLSEKKAQLQTIAQSTLPLALIERGLTGLPLVGGYAIKMKEIIGGSISKDRSANAHAWLEAHNHGTLVKHTLTISFGKGEEAWYRKFVRDLEKRKRPLKLERKDAVHPQTLSAFVREQIAEARGAGKDPRAILPYDLLGVYQFNVTEVERPRAIA